MALFEWNDRFSVNIKQVDSQHQMLVETLNELFDALKSGEARDIIAGILKSLSDYTAIHFSYEEGLMNQYNYPAYAAHKKEHEHFTQKVTEFIQKYQEGKVMLPLEVMYFLKDWLKSHIQGSDKKYAPFLNEKGVN